MIDEEDEEDALLPTPHEEKEEGEDALAAPAVPADQDEPIDFSLAKRPKRPAQQIAEEDTEPPASPTAERAHDQVAQAVDTTAKAPAPTEPTVHDRVITNNPERFKSLRQADPKKYDPVEIDQLALAGRFAQMGEGARKKWLRPSDPKDREKVVKTLVEAEAADELEGYQGKDYQHKLKATEKRLAASALGLSDLAEFQESKEEKKAKDDAKKEAAKPGAAKYTGLKFAGGVEKGLAGLLEFTAAADQFAREQVLGGGAVGRAYNAVASDKVKGAFDAFDQWLTQKAAGIRSHADSWTEGQQNAQQKQAEEALHNALDKGSVTDVAGVVLNNPRLWASEGANMMGVMSGSGGATGLARWMTMKAAGAAAKLGLSAPGMVAGFTGEALAGTQSAWDHLKGEGPVADPYAVKRETKIWQYTAARLNNPTDKQVDDLVARTLKSEDLPRQLAIQMMAFATGRAPAQAIARSLGLQVGEKVAGYTGSTVARAAKGAGASAAVGGAQGLATEVSTRATIEGAKNDKGFVPSAAEAAQHAEVWNQAALMAMFGVVPGAIHGVRAKAPPAAQPPDVSVVPSAYPHARLPAEISAKLRPETDLDVLRDPSADHVMPGFGEENRPGFEVVQPGTAGRVLAPFGEEAAGAGADVLRAGAPTDPLALPGPFRRPGDALVEAHAALDTGEPGQPARDMTPPSVRGQHPAYAGEDNAPRGSMFMSPEPVSETHQQLNPPLPDHIRWQNLFGSDKSPLHSEDRLAILKQVDQMMKDPDVAHVAEQVEMIFDAIDKSTPKGADKPVVAVGEPYADPLVKAANPVEFKPSDYASTHDLTAPAHVPEASTSIVAEAREAALKPEVEARTDTGAAPDAATRQTVDQAKAVNIREEMAKNHGELGTKALTDNFYEGANGWQMKPKRKQMLDEARARATPTPEDTALLAANELAKSTRQTKKGPSAVESRISPEDRAAIRKNGNIPLAELHAEMAVAGKDLDRVGITTHAVSTEAEARSKFPDQLGDREGFKSVYFKDDAGKPHVVMVAENLKNAADARQAFEHEVIGHHAVEDVLGREGMDALHVEIARAAHKEPKVAKMLRRVRSEYPDYSHGEQMNEFLARLAQPQTPFRSAARDIMRWLQQTMSNLGFKSLGNSKLQDFRDAMSELSYSYRRGLPKEQIAERLTDYIANGYSQHNQKNVVTEGANVIEPNKWLDNQKFYGDRMAYVHASLEAMGAKASDADLAIRALATKKAQLVKGVIYDKHLVPIEQALGKLAADLGMKYDTVRVHFDRYIAASHAYERNMAMRRAHAPLTDKAHTEAREAVINEYMRGGMSADKARTALDAIVTDANIENKAWHAENVNKSGFTNAGAAAELAKYEKLGMADHFDHLNRNEIDSLRRVLEDYNYKAGRWDRRLNELNGFRNYVPMRGTEIETQVKRRWEKPIGIMHETQERMRGREDLADHNLAQMFTEAELAANRMLNNDLLNKYRQVIDRHSEKLRAEDPESKGSHFGENVALDDSLPAYAGNRFHYADRPARHEVGDMRVYDQATGKQYDMLLKDKNVVEAFSKSQLTKMDESKLLTGLAATTRFQSRVVTAWNPKYWYSQFARDIPSSFLISYSEHKVGTERPEGKAPSVTTRWQALRETASMTVEAFKNEDMRSLFAGSAGGREDLIARWRGDLEYGLGDRYRGDPEGLAWARETRQHMIDYYDQGGVIDFAGQFEYGAKAQSDPLARASQVAQAGASASHYLDSAVQLVDAAHRFGLYTAAVKAGVPKAEAAIRARTIQDFNQRGAYNDSAATPWRYAKSSLMFLQANLTTVEAMFARRMWRGGEMPVEYVQTPDGFRQQLRGDWIKQVNAPVMGFLMASGFANVQLMSMIMGSDPETGIDNASKLHPKSWMNIGGYTLPNPFGGAPVITPGQYGLNRLMTGIGTAVGLVANGYAEPSEVAAEMLNLAYENITPVGKLRVPDYEGGENMVGMLFSGLAPAILQPLGHLSYNTNAFGQRIAPEIDPRRPRYASEAGRNTTPQEWHETARAVREAGGPDFAPEVYQSVVREYFGAAGAILDDLMKTSSGMSADRGYLNAMGLSPRQNFSADAYESRQLAKFRTDHINPLAKEWDLAKQQDQRADPQAASAGRNRVVGEREQAFLETHPEFKDWATADRNFAKASSTISAQMRAAREAGDANKVQEYRVAQKQLTAKYVKALHENDTGTLRSIGKELQMSFAPSPGYPNPKPAPSPPPPPRPYPNGT